METKKTVAILFLALGLILCQAKLCEAAPIGTAFTYQGYLYDANHPANDIYDLQFKLYDDVIGGSQVGSDVNTPDVDVIDGSFTVELDLGSGAFTGDARWLEIAVRPGDSNDRYTTLSPRQETTPAPYAVYAETAGGTPGGVGGSGTANYIAKFAGPNMISDSVIYESGDNVGIGTTNPGAKLEVNGPIKVTDGSQGAGKVLTSDASGLASWQSPSSGSGTYYWSCVGANFHPQYNTNSTKIDRDGAYIEAQTNGMFFFAPVMLPHGANVTKVVVYGNAAATAEDWAFRKINLNSAAMSVIESAKIGTEVTCPGPRIIDNNTYAYLLWTASLDTGDVIYNAKITYTK